MTGTLFLCSYAGVRILVKFGELQIILYNYKKLHYYLMKKYLLIVEAQTLTL